LLDLWQRQKSVLLVFHSLVGPVSVNLNVTSDGTRRPIKLNPCV
jgi:hypothetical protein